MPRHTRRSFLKRTAAAGLATTLAIPATRASARVLGANDRINLKLKKTTTWQKVHLPPACPASP